MRGKGTVGWFGEWMLKKLTENEHKPHWSGERLDVLVADLRVEVRELDAALDMFGVMTRSKDEYSDLKKIRIATDVIKECADVANFSMMIADNVSKCTLKMVFRMSKAEVLRFLCTEEPAIAVPECQDCGSEMELHGDYYICEDCPCSCHISPPCSRCVGAVSLEDWLKEDPR